MRCKRTAYGLNPGYGPGYGRGFAPGYGRGQGFAPGYGRGYGPGYGMGLGGQCICPNCGYKTEHTRSQPCLGLPCPQCGTKMTRNMGEVTTQLDNIATELEKNGKQKAALEIDKISDQLEGK